MNVIQFPLSEIGFNGKLMMDYIEGHPQLRPFYKYLPHLDSFADVMEQRSKFPMHREVLKAQLLKQNAEYLQEFPLLKSNIDSISNSKTFTVTTGHQLCIAGGPSYFIYKIISTLKLAQSLQSKYPENNFVPVYWMASEDHDIEEINHVHVFGNTLKWETKEQGPSGKVSLDSLPVFLKDLMDLFSNSPQADVIQKLLTDAYSKHQNLSEATRAFVLNLFGEYGLVVLDANSKELKSLFKSIMRDELDEQASASIVEKTSELLAKNYKVQVNPREINLFYLDEQLRERIIVDDQHHYKVITTDLKFSRELMLDIVDKQVERFSPNVVLRPLYQESILPNLATIGGPGELAYWLQLKDLFDHYSIAYPLLVPRNNALILQSKALDKFTKLGFKASDMFRDYDDLVREWLGTQEDIAPEIEKAKESLQNIFDELEKVFIAADSTLAASVQSEWKKTVNGLDQLGKKGNAALKRKHEVALNQISSLIEKVNPHKMPQERYENFLSFYSSHGKELIVELIKNFEAFDFKFTVLVD